MVVEKPIFFEESTVISLAQTIIESDKEIEKINKMLIEKESLIKNRQNPKMKNKLSQNSKDISKASISRSGPYIGPNYSLPKSNFQLSNQSFTSHRHINNQAIEWEDFYGTNHRVETSNNQ